MKQVKLCLVICGIILVASSCGSPAQDAASSGTLTGTWVLDLTQYKQEYADFEYMEQSSNCMLYTLSLCNDSTYVAKFGFTQAGGTYEPNVGLIPDGTTEFHISEDEYTGNYALIHDGASISFDDAGYFDFELSEGVLEITGQNGGTYLYHRSGTVDKAGTYQLCELNGIPANQLSEEEILELREDHLVTVHRYSPDGAIIGQSAPLIMGFTWQLEDGELLISDSHIPMEAELDDNGFTLISRFGEMVDERVYKLVGSD